MRRPIRSVPRVRIAPQRVEASQLRRDSVNDSSALTDLPKVSFGNSGLQVCTKNRHVVEARGSRWGKAPGPTIDHRVIHRLCGWLSGSINSTRQCPKRQAGRRHAHAGRPTLRSVTTILSGAYRQSVRASSLGGFWRRCWPLRADTSGISVIQTEVPSCRANRSRHSGTPSARAPRLRHAPLAQSEPGTPACHHSDRVSPVCHHYTLHTGDTKNAAKAMVSPVWAGVTSITLYIHVGGKNGRRMYAYIGERGI